MKSFSFLNSERFIQLVLIAALQSLVLFNVISGDQGTGLINIISGLFGASVVIRTVDRQTDVAALGGSRQAVNRSVKKK